MGTYLEAILDNCRAFYELHGPFIWVGLGLVIAILIAVRFVRSMGRQIPIGSSDYGTIAASLSAIQEVMRRTCESIVPRSHPAIRVRLRRGNVRIRIRLKAPAGENVQSLSQQIQQRAAENLQEQFGFETVGGIDVIVTGFRSGRDQKGDDERRPGVAVHFTQRK